MKPIGSGGTNPLISTPEFAAGPPNRALMQKAVGTHPPQPGPPRRSLGQPTGDPQSFQSHQITWAQINDRPAGDTTNARPLPPQNRSHCDPNLRSCDAALWLWGALAFPLFPAPQQVGPAGPRATTGEIVSRRPLRRPGPPWRSPQAWLWQGPDAGCSRRRVPPKR